MLSLLSSTASRITTSVLCLLLAVAGAAPGGAAFAATVDPLVRDQLLGGADAVQVIVETAGYPAPVAAFAELLGVEVTWTYTIIDAFAGLAPAAAIEILAADLAVEAIHPDQPVGPVMDVSHRAVEADRAWDAGFQGAGVTVAILDTGIDNLHPWFAGALVACVSVVSGVVLPECNDTEGHGTHVAGTVASRDPELPGVAPAASLASVRVLHGGAGLSSDTIAGMEWVRDNKDAVNPPIRVVNMSLGPLQPGCGNDSNPSAQAANNLMDSGVFVAVAAGNAGNAGCTIDGASAASRVATIAAVDDLGTVAQEDDVIASFSSGGGGVLAKPDVAFPGVGITSAFPGAGLLISTLSGTSMATPHAAGTAALLFEQDGTRTPQDVKTLMTERALKTANSGASWNDLYGHGLGNACRALGLETCTHPIAPPEPFELSATGSRVKGFQQAELTWTGAGSAQVDVYRDGVLVATTANDGAHVDAIGVKGKGVYAYQVCEAGAATCSNPVAVAF
jgi:subtilisin family serine protease